MKQILLVFCVLLMSTGCVRMNAYRMRPDRQHALLAYEAHNANLAQAIYTRSCKDEMAKVFYLINRVRFSSNQFNRNGAVFNAGQAAQWLEYKAEKFQEEIHDVEDFIEEVGSFSRSTGKEYHLIFPDGYVCPVKMIFYNELKAIAAS